MYYTAVMAEDDFEIASFDEVGTLSLAMALNYAVNSEKATYIKQWVEDEYHIVIDEYQLIAIREMLHIMPKSKLNAEYGDFVLELIGNAQERGYEI